MKTSFVVEYAAPKTVVIQIGMALDFRSAEAFKTVYQELLRSGTQQFILDFSDTSVLDSTGLGALFSLHRQVSPLGGQVVIASPSSPVQMVWQLTRTHRIFPKFSSVHAAREALSRAAA